MISFNFDFIFEGKMFVFLGDLVLFILTERYSNQKPPVHNLCKC